MKSTKYELKYCEGCGTLKLRPVTSEKTYCMRCEWLLSRYSLSKRARGGAAVSLPSAAEIKELVGISPEVSDATVGRGQ